MLAVGWYMGLRELAPKLFQLLAQALVLSQRLLQLLLQRSYSLFKLFFAIRGPASIGRFHPFDNDTSRRICPVP